MEKHSTYFDFLDAFKGKGCPVCFLVKRRIHKFMENLLYENVNDSVVRKKIREGLGFCNLHSWQLQKFGDGLGLSIIYEDLFNTIKDKIKKSINKKLDMKLDCLICKEKKDAEKIFVSSFIEYFNDREFNSSFRSSFGLCLPHFLSIVKYCKNKNIIVELCEIEIEKINSLVKELSEFQRKHDYRFSDKGYGKEKDSWIRAIEKMTGKEGI